MQVPDFTAGLTAFDTMFSGVLAQFWPWILRIVGLVVAVGVVVMLLRRLSK